MFSAGTERDLQREISLKTVTSISFLILCNSIHNNSGMEYGVAQGYEVAKFKSSNTDSSVRLMEGSGLTHYVPVLPSYRNQSIDLLCKSIDRLLYENNTGT